MTDRLMPWHQPPDDPGFWERKKMEPEKEYTVKLSVLIDVDARSRDDAEKKATALLDAAITGAYAISDIETEEVEEV